MVVARLAGIVGVLVAAMLGPAPASAQPFSTIGPERTIVILAKFQDTGADPYDPATVKPYVFTGEASTSAFWRATSGGNTWLTGVDDPEGDVAGWYTIPYPSTDCTPYESGWRPAARQAAIDAGIDLTRYDFILIGFAPNQCFNGGRAAIWNDASGHTWRQAAMYAATPVWNLSGIARHEVGHLYGNPHSFTHDCVDAGGDQVTLSDTCTDREYGDMYDVMGSGTYQLNSYRRLAMGWLPSSNVQTIDPTTEAGEFDLHRTGQPDDSVQVMRIVRTRDGAGTALTYYYLEARGPAPFDPFHLGVTPTDGVLFRIAPDFDPAHRGSKASLIDANPIPAPHPSKDAAFTSGRVFHDPVNDLWIKVLWVTADTVRVRIGTDAPPAAGLPASTLRRMAGTGAPMACGASTADPCVAARGRATAWAGRAGEPHLSQGAPVTLRLSRRTAAGWSLACTTRTTAGPDGAYRSGFAAHCLGPGLHRVEASVGATMFGRGGLAPPRYVRGIL